jgi:hypothetical protein
MMAHATDPALKEESFLSICDLLIMFAHVGQAPLLAPLNYRADQSMGEFLNLFIQVGCFQGADPAFFLIADPDSGSGSRV